jgi:hypothetical protein
MEGWAMIFSLDIRRARKGDCLLLHAGSQVRPVLVLIDGGPKAVYGPHLRPRLKDIRAARGLPTHMPLPVDLLMVSHVDDDHIQGILDLMRDLRDASGTPLVQLRRIWHNSFEDIIDNDPHDLTSSIQAQFGAAALDGQLPEDATVDRDDLDEEVVRSTLKVLASIPQGQRLRRDAEALSVQTNPEFDNHFVLANPREVAITQDLTFVVAGPMAPELASLKKAHTAWLEELKKKGMTPDEALAAYVDTSVPNLSSIVAVARAGGKTILLTGDARGDRILQGLEQVDLLAAGQTLHVDILKVPHHGSANNLETDFFRRVTADHYVFSGNGKHGNPEREAMEMLFDARGAASFTVHLTYPIDEVDRERQKEWEKQQDSERARNAKRLAAGKPPLAVRADWSPSRHSLARFFEQHPLASGQAIHVVPATGAHVIDLLDPLGF